MAVVGDDAWTTFEVSGERVLARYDLEGAVDREPVSGTVSADLLPPGVPWRLEATEVASIPSDCGVSYMSHEAAENRLWTGTFSTSSGASVCVFALNEDGSLGDREERWTLPIPKVQGILALEDGRALLSQSYGDADSGLFIWTPGTSSAERVLSGPAGFEDLALSPEGLIWTASESGARYFQKRNDSNDECSPNWIDLYPYVFALEPDAFISP